MSKIKLPNQIFETQLVKNFPKLYKHMRGDPSKTCMAWGIEINNGWFDLIWELSQNIEPLIGDADIHAEQVKEKFGTLRFYINDYSNEEIASFVSAAEKQSCNTCEECGEEGKIRTNGWHTTLCNQHYKERRGL